MDTINRDFPDNIVGFFKVKLNELCIHENRSYTDKEKEMLERLEKLDKIIQGIKEHPKIINDSVRFDSAWGVSRMLHCSDEEAKEIKQIWYLLREVIGNDR